MLPQDNQPQPSQDQQEPSQGQPEQDPSRQANSDSGQEAQEEVQSQAGNADAEGADNEDADAGAANGDKEPPKGTHKKSGYHRRIANLERQVAEKDALLAQALARVPQPTQPQAPVNETPEQKAAREFDAFVGKVVDQRLQSMQQQQAETQQQAAAQALAQKWETQLPADEEQAYEVRKWIAHFHGLKAGPVKEALLTSEFLPRIIETLQSNPAELARIDALPPGQAAREIGRFEAKFASGAAPQKPVPAKRPPAPPGKVGGSAPSTRSVDDLPLADYKRAKRKGA